jgi:hypothetical protein
VTSKTKTDWTFHRANFAVNYSSLSVAGYARQFDLNPNTAKAGLRGALTDPDNEQINLSEYDPGTGERLAGRQDSGRHEGFVNKPPPERGCSFF